MVLILAMVGMGITTVFMRTHTMYIKYTVSRLLRGCVLFSVLNIPTFCKSATSVLSNQLSSPSIFLLDKSHFWKCYQFLISPHLSRIIPCFVPWLYGYTSDQINLKISQSAGELHLAQGSQTDGFHWLERQLSLWYSHCLNLQDDIFMFLQVVCCELSSQV